MYIFSVHACVHVCWECSAVYKCVSKSRYICTCMFIVGVCAYLCVDVKSWLKRPWCWERLKAGEEGNDRGWDGWMASPAQWTWVWVNSGGWRKTGRPGVLQSMGSQRVGHDWVTELNCMYNNMCECMHVCWSAVYIWVYLHVCVCAHVHLCIRMCMLRVEMGVWMCICI